MLSHQCTTPRRGKNRFKITQNIRLVASRQFPIRVCSFTRAMLQLWKSLPFSDRRRVLSEWGWNRSRRDCGSRNDKRIGPSSGRPNRSRKIPSSDCFFHPQKQAAFQGGQCRPGGHLVVQSSRKLSRTKGTLPSRCIHQ